MSAVLGSGRGIPWGAILAASVVGGIALVGIEAPRRTRPLPVAAATVVAARDLRFEDQANGGIAVLDAATGVSAGTVAPGEGGFLRGVMRGFARVRERQGADPRLPFRLVASSGGRLVMTDPATGTAAELEGFGMTNAASFARFLPAREPAP